MNKTSENKITSTIAEQQDMVLKSYIELKDITDNLFIVSSSLIIGLKKLFDNDITKVVSLPFTAKDMAPTPVYYDNCFTSFSFMLDKINPEKKLSEKQLNEFKRFLTLAINDSVFPLDPQYDYKDYEPTNCNKIEILNLQNLDSSIKVELLIVNNQHDEAFTLGIANNG